MIKRAWCSLSRSGPMRSRCRYSIQRSCLVGSRGTSITELAIRPLWHVFESRGRREVVRLARKDVAMGSEFSDVACTL